MYKVIWCFTALSVALTCVAAAKSAVHVPLPPSNPLKAAEQEKLNSKPANVLFAEKELPSLGKAMAIGYYPRGCLQGGVELPVSGPNWQVMRVSRNRNWGHPELVKFLERFAPLARRSHRLARHLDRRYGPAARRPASIRTSKPPDRA